MHGVKVKPQDSERSDEQTSGSSSGAVQQKAADIDGITHGVKAKPETPPANTDNQPKVIQTQPTATAFVLPQRTEVQIGRPESPEKPKKRCCCCRIFGC